MRFMGEGGAISATRGDAVLAAVVNLVGGDLRRNVAKDGLGGAVFGAEGAIVSFDDVQVRGVDSGHLSAAYRDKDINEGIGYFIPVYRVSWWYLSLWRTGSPDTFSETC